MGGLYDLGEALNESDQTMTKTQCMDLKPCPFCGSTELLQTDKMVVEQVEEVLGSEGGETGEPEEWFVVCGMCSAMGPLSPSSDDAQAAWNKRSNGKPGI